MIIRTGRALRALSAMIISTGPARAAAVTR